MPKKTTVTLTAAIKEAVLLLCYRKKKPTYTDRRFMPLKQIASTLGLTYLQVRYICRRCNLQKKRPPKQLVPARVIEAE